MGKMKAEIEIILRSDLCAGSGYSYAGIIDSDICYNENGIPYIPARRLKGCLREAAELIKVENTDKLFGLGGENKSCAISISNAYPKDYEQLNEEIEQLKKGEYKKELTTQKVLEQYSYIKAQTAIDSDTGVVKENSLRYTRVVKQYSPLDNNEMRFYSDIIYDRVFDSDVNRIVKALRHIGMNRSRGLGNVQCRVINKINVENNIAMTVCSENKQVRLDYTIKNLSPLMISGNFDDCTDTFIKGQTVIGALAAQYLLQNGRSASDELFYELFLSGHVKYSNLYISEKDDDGFKKFAPAPLFINSLKKSGKIVNVTKKSENETFGDGGEYDAKNGNQPKKLKGKYVCVSEDNSSIVATKPALDIVYHHSKRAKFSKNIDRDDNESGLLYSMEVLRESQFFSGSITGEKKYVDIIFGLLDTLSLG